MAISNVSPAIATTGWAAGFRVESSPRGNAELAGEPDAPLIATSMEPRKRPRTRLTIDEVGAIRTARANGASVAALATQFGIHRGTVWAKSRT